MIVGSWIDGVWIGEGPDPATLTEALRRGHRIVKRAGEDSADARERRHREKVSAYLLPAALAVRQLGAPPPLAPWQRDLVGPILARAAERLIAR